MRHWLPAFVLACAVILGCAPSCFGWGPHPDITRAAMEVLPEAEHWKQVLGDQYYRLTNYSWMPDGQGEDAIDYYIDDYLLIPALPHYVTHGGEDVKQTWRPYFVRALQALRTETPINAARQLGPIIHFTEDTGSPPHAAAWYGTLHGPLENWVKADQITIQGYVPQRLGDDDASAVTGLTKRLEGLMAFSLERANRARPFAEQGEVGRPQVEPIILESALECARVLADVMHTLFTLAEAPAPPGAGLRGSLTAGPFHPGSRWQPAKPARVVLLDDARFQALGAAPATLAPALTNYSTDAYPVTPQPTPGPWTGSFEWRNLPPGTYRLWVYRTGSLPVVSAPVTLTAGQVTELKLDLPADEPAGNMVQNPRGTIAVLTAEPERWHYRDKVGWITEVGVEKGLTYRCGAILRDPQARVSFTTMRLRGLPPLTQELGAVAAGVAPPEVTVTAGEDEYAIDVAVRTTRPLAEALEKVWIVPAR